MDIERNEYLSKLINRKKNGLIKIVTGVRRCGKSYLLFKLFYQHLILENIAEDHIIDIQLDDFKNRKLLNPDILYEYVTSKIVDGDDYYILLDEIQLVENFESVLNGFLHISNTDIYVTGSNSRFLSSDIITEFRGRGDEIRVYPLTFREFMSVYDGTPEEGWKQYFTYGGMPLVLSQKGDNAKADYLNRLFEQTYLTDIINRHNLRGNDEIGEVTNILASAVGSLTNPLKLSNTFRSVKGINMSPQTVSNYLEYLQDSFLVDRAIRYDIKGKKYINTPQKYYFTDVGLRNARLNFRQQEENHIMENVIFNELKCRGYSVDVGIVQTSTRGTDGKKVRKQLEVDFVANQRDRRYYIQSAFEIGTPEKMMQEQNSFLHIDDSFKKIMVVRDSIIPWHNEKGFLIVGLIDFLLKPEMMDM